MHGIIFQQLTHFVVKNYGFKQWSDLLEAAGLKGKLYLPNQIYPDAEVFALVAKASEATKLPVPAVLEAFGEFIAPSLLKIYNHSLNPDWTLLDLLEHTEITMHKAVRFADKSATPPALNCERISKDKVAITYDSSRKMIDVGIGIIKGFAKIKNEEVSINRIDQQDSTRLEITVVN